MKPGTYSARRRHDETQMVVADPRSFRFTSFGTFKDFLRPADLVVMNDSGTMPASFQFTDGEIRLAAFAGRDLSELQRWWAFSFAPGSWRQPTEERTAAPRFEVGQILDLSAELKLRVVEVRGRLLQIEFISAQVTDQIFRLGKPIQYSYHREDLALWDIQTPLSSVPISVEAPSALFPFNWRMLMSLRKQTAYLNHGAGISSTGEPELDALLPLPEFFSIPEKTWSAVEQTKKNGGRVIAIGTSAARALESASSGNLSGHTSLKLGPERPMQVVDGLLTGFHEPETSHFQLEAALLPFSRISDTFLAAQRREFLGHEYGDVALLFKNVI